MLLSYESIERLSELAKLTMEQLYTQSGEQVAWKVYTEIGGFCVLDFYLADAKRKIVEDLIENTDWSCDEAVYKLLSELE